MTQETHNGSDFDPRVAARTYLDRAFKWRRRAEEVGLNEKTRESYLQLALSYEALADEIETNYANRAKKRRSAD